MVRIAVALLLGVLVHGRTMTADSAPCPVQRGAATGRHVWLLCGQRLLYVSSDGGLTWQPREIPFEAALRAVALIDASRGLVAGDGGALLATEDGARSWRRVPLPTRDDLSSIHFVGELGWLAGASGTILHSADGGRSWTPQNSGVGLGLDSIFFADASHGWAVGWVGTILRTTDGGKTWRQVRTPHATWSLSSVYFRDAKTGWAVGFNGQILRSRDGGATWERQPSPSGAWLTSVVFDSSGRGWIAARDQVLVSDDGGNRWRAVPAEGALFLEQVLPVGDSLWAISRFGIFKGAAGAEFTALPAAPGEGRASARLDN